METALVPSYSSAFHKIGVRQRVISLATAARPAFLEEVNSASFIERPAVNLSVTAWSRIFISYFNVEIHRNTLENSSGVSFKRYPSADLRKRFHESLLSPGLKTSKVQVTPQASRYGSSMQVASCASMFRAVETEHRAQENYRIEDWDSQDLASLVLETGGLQRKMPQESSLRSGTWAKLICGASFEDVVEVRNLSLVYTLAGIDCIDCAADAAVVSAVVEGVDAAISLARDLLRELNGPDLRRPWIMISINDDEDPHFRKAVFDAAKCPPDCSRPCENVCPASAIKFTSARQHLSPQEGLERMAVGSSAEISAATLAPLEGGVMEQRCYGCGRCLPLCPLGLISAETYVRDTDSVAALLRSHHVDAIEIHTRLGHLAAFKELWVRLGDAVSGLKLVAVSLPELGKGMGQAMRAMHEIMEPSLSGLNLWQLDGRPMSGDIGAGATRAAVLLTQRVLSMPERPPGFIQLAGGTNSHTVPALQKAGLFRTAGGDLDAHECDVAGVAYGGYARKIVEQVLKKVDVSTGQFPVQPGKRPIGAPTCTDLELYPHLLVEAVQAAIGLLAPLKGYMARPARCE